MTFGLPLDDLEQLPWPWAVALGGVLGMVVGSYLATVFIRWPQGHSANYGRSRCDSCARQLRWFELVPLVSWTVTRGRCRTCSLPIDPAHMRIEVLCGIVGGTAFAAGLPMLAPMGWLLIVLSFFDAAYLWLPDRLVLPLALASLLAPSSEASLALRIIGGAIGFAALWLVAVGFRRITGKVGLGGGDAKLFGAIGLWCGALQLPTVMLLACAIGLGDAIVRMLKGRARSQMQLPLGTYLAISTIALTSIYAWISLQLPANITVATPE